MGNTFPIIDVPDPFNLWIIKALLEGSSTNEARGAHLNLFFGLRQLKVAPTSYKQGEITPIIGVK